MLHLTHNYLHIVQDLAKSMDRLSDILQTFTPVSRQVRLLTPVNSYSSSGSTIACCSTGSARLTHSGNSQTIETGELIWLTHPEQFQLKLAANSQLLICQLDMGPNQLNPLFDQLPHCVQVAANDSEHGHLAPTLALLMTESQSHRCGQTTVLNRLAEVLMVQLLRLLIERQKLEFGVLAGLGDIRLARAITAMHGAPEQRWSVDELARCAGMSRSAFNQLFRDTVGCPPGEYLGRWRMRLACQLLAASQLPTSQIVEQLGYLSEAAFLRAFKRRVGTSPNKYRRSFNGAIAAAATG